MEKVLRLVFVLFFLSGISLVTVFGQCDSLAIAIKEQKGENQIDALNKYAKCFIWTDFDKMDSLSRLANVKAKELNYPMGLAMSNENLGLVLQFSENNNEAAIELYHNALFIYSDLGDSLKVGKILGDLSASYETLLQYGAALNSLIRGMNIFEAENFTRGVAVYANNIGAIYQSSGEYMEANKYFHKALNLTDSINDTQNYSYQLGNILNTGIYLKNQDSVDYYLERALSYQKKTGNKDVVALTYGNMQSYYQDIKDVESPIFKLRETYSDSELVYAEKTQNELALMRAKAHKGIIQHIKGNDNFAYNLLLESIQVSEEIEVLEDIQVEIYSIMASISFGRGNYAVGEKELLRAIEIQEIIHEAQLEESIFEAESKYKVTQAIRALDLAEKDKEITALQLKSVEVENEKNRMASEKKQLQLYSIGGFLILALLLAAIAFNAFRNKKKDNKVILEQKIEVEKQRQEIELQKMSVEEKNREILDSIGYARKIQESMLPSQELITEYLKNAFVLYKPKDIVSGDFYWVQRRGEEHLFAVADCTGVGVPGAMVSVVCSNSLTRAAELAKTGGTANILKETQKLVVAALSKSNNNKGRHGMDIGLCSISGYQLNFSGANRPLWVCREGEILEYKGDSQSIGNKDEITPFSNVSVTLQKGDVVYLFSNGFIDQFGGDDGKKLQKSHLKRLVIAMHTFESFKQKGMIERAFEDWKGDLEQLDDICMIGVKID